MVVQLFIRFNGLDADKEKVVVQLGYVSKSTETDAVYSAEKEAKVESVRRGMEYAGFTYTGHDVSI